MTGFIERAGLAVLALIAASLVVWLAMPVGVGLLIGTLTAFALEPFQQRLAAGVELMGLPGLIVGPVLMSLALAALRIYEGEAMRLRERPPP